MARFGGKAQTGSAMAPWLLLAFPGFVLALAGVSVMQQQCGQSGANSLTNIGSSAYWSPVTCDRFFSFDWFIVFFFFFVWLVVGFFLFSKTVHTMRNGLVALLAVAAVLMMFATNSWFRPWGGHMGNAGLTSKFIKGAKVAFSGGIISAFSALLMLMILGLHDEKDVEHKDRDVCPPGYVPATTTTTVPVGTTTTTTQPVGESRVTYTSETV